MNDSPSILKTSLLDLLYELRSRDVPLILGGGYGLYLRQVQLQEAQASSTLILCRSWRSGTKGASDRTLGMCRNAVTAESGSLSRWD